MIKAEVKLGANVFGKAKMSSEMTFVLLRFIEKLGWRDTIELSYYALWMAVFMAGISIAIHIRSAKFSR